MNNSVHNFCVYSTILTFYPSGQRCNRDDSCRIGRAHISQFGQTPNFPVGCQSLWPTCRESSASPGLRGIRCCRYTVHYMIFLMDVNILYFTQKDGIEREKSGHSLFTLTSLTSSAVKRSSYLFLSILYAGFIGNRMSKLDQIFALFFAKKVIKCDYPWRLHQVAPKAHRLFLRGVLVKGFGSREDTHRVINHPLLDRNTFRLIPRSRAYDPFEHGIQFPRQQARRHIVSQWRTASSDIDQIACLTGGCTHNFHVTVIRLAICKKRN